MIVIDASKESPKAPDVGVWYPVPGDIVACSQIVFEHFPGRFDTRGISLGSSFEFGLVIKICVFQTETSMSNRPDRVNIICMRSDMQLVERYIYIDHKVNDMYDVPGCASFCWRLIAAGKNTHSNLDQDKKKEKKNPGR